MTPIPKIFISYSWTTPTHEDWVINLAERLVSDGIDVVIDKWDLKEGHDKYTFMESMVLSTDIVKVLIIGVAPTCVVPKSVPLLIDANELYDTAILSVPVTSI